MSDLREKQLSAALLLKNAFDIPRVNEAEIANQVFPPRAEDTREHDRTVVNSGIAKLRKVNAAPYRAVLTEVEFLRSSDLKRPDSHASFLFSCRKNHVYRCKQEISDPNRDPSTPLGSGSHSPFLRRSASRDPIRDKIKEEVCSPSPLLQSNGTPVYRSRSRSNLRSHSTLSGTENYPMTRNSVEKQSSVINPLYERSNVHPKSSSFFSTPLNNHADNRMPKTDPIKQNMLSYREPPSYASSSTKVVVTGQPAYVPLDELCKELRGALHGITGKYFVDDGCGNIIISLTCAISDPHRQLVNDLLTLANTYIELKRRVQTTEEETVSSALLYGISQKLDEYATAVCDISLRTPNHLLLVKISLECVHWSKYLAVLSTLTAIAKGQSSIEILNNAFFYLKSTLFTVHERTVHSCVTTSFRIFCSSLRRWLMKGEIAPNDEWMITADKEGGYHVTEYPKFLDRDLCDKIHKIGVSQHLVTSEDITELHKFHAMIDKELCPELILNPDRLIEIVNAMSKLIGKVVISRLKDEGRLIEHLNILKQFLLLEDPFFTGALYDKLMECSHGLQTSISKSDASAAFVWAISKSPYRPKTNSCVKIDILQSTGTSPNSSSRLQFVQPLSPVYHVQGIAAKVFVKTNECYDLLFHFIWSVELSVANIKDAFDKLRTIVCRDKKRTEIRMFERLCLRIVNKFSRILFHIRQYTSQMVQTQYSYMLARLENVADIESASVIHQKFLSNLKTAFFCDGNHDTACNLIATILHLSYDLTKIVTEYNMDVSSQQKESTTTNEAGNMDTLREFEEVEKRIDIDSQLIGNRRSKIKVIEASITKTMKDVSSWIPIFKAL
ncbi:unnamed protein product [Auanema sp. JU1783]|nr:unnamed protein product [Auanema sp. JU1783]